MYGKLDQDRNMDTRKGKSGGAAIIANRRAPRNDSAGKSEDVEVVQTSLATGSELSIADDGDFGRDPYNSTGQYVVLKAKQLGAE
jgi:hypothetical protein